VTSKGKMILLLWNVEQQRLVVEIHIGLHKPMRTKQLHIKIYLKWLDLSLTKQRKL
jgi:hypothetical protein